MQRQRQRKQEKSVSFSVVVRDAVDESRISSSNQKKIFYFKIID